MLDKNYQPQNYEKKIYQTWEKSGAFHHEIDHNKKPFTISMPPPNATGVLHTGHAMFLTIEDIMTRYARMKGFCTLWVPGTDHAAIATQNKVEKILAAEGLTRHDLGRAKFLERVKAYVAESQNIIRNQIRRMGASCDWQRERYTLDDDLNHAVREVFLRMYNDGLIYRGYRIVNWCPRCASTLADDEVGHQEVDATLYHIQYGPFVIATSRPETKLGDAAAAVHPKDKRYQALIGQEMDIDLAGHQIHIKVIADKEVDMKFGSGVVGVTPAHSIIDFEMAQKNKIQPIQVINEAGKMTDRAGKYAGMEVLACRQAFLNDLQAAGLIIKTEPYKQNLSICYRCHTTIEPLMSKQWFIDVNKPIYQENGKKKSIKDKCIEVVKNKEIKIVPERFNKIYFHWMNELRDWCISRQIWWGHRIPVWYCQDCEAIVVDHQAPPRCPQCGSKKLKQDEDTLDTWFSSGLWTFSTLGWPKDTEELKYFHPTTIMETGYDILFFWVARMIIMSTYTVREVPFKTVYLHGLIRCKTGEKMSKSNPETCIDPLDMVDKYGADALRLALIIGTTPGNDAKIYEEKIANFRNFVNKLWNASRFVLINLENINQIGAVNPRSLADQWIVSRLQTIIKKVTKNFDAHQYSEAGQELYDFLWNEVCDWYLEISKETKNETVIKYVLQTFLQLIHPFIPYVSEVLWQETQNKSLLINEPWPEVHQKLINKPSETTQQLIINVIKSIRNMRAENKVPAAKMIPVILYGHQFTNIIEENKTIIKKLARIDQLTISKSGTKISNSATNIISGIEIFIPLSEMIDLAQEKNRLQKEITDAEKYIKQLQTKLNNKNFVKNAPPAIVEAEKKKLAEAEERMGKLTMSLKELG